MYADIVSAVADHNQGLLFAPAEVELMERHLDRVVQSRSAFRHASPQGSPQLLDIVGKQLYVGQPAPRLLIEVDDENLVLRIAGLNERQSGGDYLRLLGPHAAALVHHQPYGDGVVLMGELSYLLLLPVLVHFEV